MLPIPSGGGRQNLAAFLVPAILEPWPLPERLRWVEGAKGERVWAEAGQLRDRFVQVGVHIAPTARHCRFFATLCVVVLTVAFIQQ